MSEIAVTVLEVDGREPGVPGEPGRGDELIDQPIELLVGDDSDTIGKPSIEERVGIGGERLRLSGAVRPGVAPRVGQLQADVKIAIGVGPEPFPMGRDEFLSQRARCWTVSCGVNSS